MCRTARCRLPNTNPETGEKDPHEPDKTLKKFRRVDDGAAEYACLGMQMVPDIKSRSIKFDSDKIQYHRGVLILYDYSAAGMIKVGDPVVVLETGQHHYIRQ